MPNAVPDGPGTTNLASPGEAANFARLHLAPASTTLPNAYASATVNSLGLLDLIELAASGLSPKAQYQVYLADSPTAPFGKLEPLAILKTNPIGPLKTLAPAASPTAPSRRFLVVTELGNLLQVVLRQQL